MSIAPATRRSLAMESFPDPELSDLELVARAQDDSRSFALLYGRYLDPVYQYCYRRLHSREAAEDATSQVFMKALKGLPKFSNQNASFRGWLFTIAHNVVMDHYRSTRPTNPLDTEIELPDRSPSPEELAIAADASRSLRKAVENLPERQRQVIELRLAGLTGPEIGQVLGCQSRTVDVTQFRAVTSLRKLLGPHGITGGRV